MRLQQLLYVKEIARCRSMNQAAVRLYISQPSLSEAIRDLEKEFGITLFDRSRRGVSLTASNFYNWPIKSLPMPTNCATIIS